MTLKKLISMWQNEYSSARFLEVYRCDSGKESFIMTCDRYLCAHELKDGFLDRNVVKFAVTEDKLRVVVDAYARGDDMEFISPAEFYGLIDKSCIDLDGSEDWLEELKGDREPCIKCFEFNPIRDELLITYAKIPHCPMWAGVKEE